MKKIILFVSMLILSTGVVFATDETLVEREQAIQNRVNNVGIKILNANKIEKRVGFVYCKKDKKSFLKKMTEVDRRNIVLYENDYKFVENDDELAALVSRGIMYALKSYGGFWNGYLSAFQVKAAPKAYEIVADKRAVDFMVTAGYDPIGLITYIHKSSPQKKFDRFSNKNLTSKRLAIIYEYIFTKYPYFLANNKYLETETYQNFLLTSIDNRKKLEDKIMRGSKEKVKYE